MALSPRPTVASIKATNFSSSFVWSSICRFNQTYRADSRSSLAWLGMALQNKGKLLRVQMMNDGKLLEVDILMLSLVASELNHPMLGCVPRPAGWNLLNLMFAPTLNQARRYLLLYICTFTRSHRHIVLVSSPRPNVPEASHLPLALSHTLGLLTPEARAML